MHTPLGSAILCILCVAIGSQPLSADDDSESTPFSEYNAAELKKGEYAFSVKARAKGDDASFTGTFRFKGVVKDELKSVKEDLRSDLSTTAFAINDHGLFITSSKIALP